MTFRFFYLRLLKLFFCGFKKVTYLKAAAFIYPLQRIF